MKSLAEESDAIGLRFLVRHPVEAEWCSRPKTVFALGGGGNLGAVQVGMLRALFEEGVTPDAVVGASIGAINGAVLAFNPGLAGVERLEALWSGTRRSQVFPLRVRTVAHGLLDGTGLVSHTGLRARLDEAGMTGTRLEEAAIHLCVVATDLSSGRPVVLKQGDTVEALLASAAIPRVFPPVLVGGRRLVDGALRPGSPLAQALDLRPRQVYVLPARPTASATLATTEIAVHLLPVPRAVAGVRPYDFRSTGRLIASAYAVARQWLAGQGTAASRELVVA